MAYLLNYKAKTPEQIKPGNGENFTAQELCSLLDCPRVEFRYILSHQGRFSPFILAYNPKYYNNLDYFNLLATRAYLRGKHSQNDYTIYCISMRLNKRLFFDRYPEISVIGGTAVLGSISEMKDFGYNKDSYK